MYEIIGLKIKKDGLNIIEDLLENFSLDDLVDVVKSFKKEEQKFVFDILEPFAKKPSHLKKIQDAKAKLA